MTQQEKDIIKGLAKRYSCYGISFKVSGNSRLCIEAFVDDGNRKFSEDYADVYEFARFIIVFIYRRYIEHLFDLAEEDYGKEFYRVARMANVVQSDIVSLAKNVKFYNK